MQPRTGHPAAHGADLPEPHHRDVVARDPGAAPDEEEVKRFFLERGAPYAHPRRVFFLDQLPLGGTGKLDRSALKRQAAALPPIESQR